MPLKLISIKPSEKATKKYKATFNDGTTTHFGSKGYDDYTKHKDDKRKSNYLARHRKNENWNNPKTAGSLSRFILWNKMNIKDSVANYKSRFNL